MPQSILQTITTYDLVSRGKNVGNINQCWGAYDETSRQGWGPGYQYNCIHSGEIVTSGYLPTTWYNYPLATAGTIISENTSSSNPANNTTTATESVCPKGWTLPTETQIDSQRNANIFSPTLGGRYRTGNLYNETTHGLWWGSEADNGALRYRIGYTNSRLYTSTGSRDNGDFIRCVQKSAIIP